MFLSYLQTSFETFCALINVALVTLITLAETHKGFHVAVFKIFLSKSKLLRINNFLTSFQHHLSLKKTLSVAQ